MSVLNFGPDLFSGFLWNGKLKKNISSEVWLLKSVEGIHIYIIFLLLPFENGVADAMLLCT